MGSGEVIAMRRREFIAILDRAPFGLPTAGHAQQHPRPVIGYLSTITPTPALQEAFRSGLGQGL
jgi:hypothetical protein